jgi:diamine N-acetyltransferase
MKIRPAQMSDYDQLCELFDEVDLLHRETRPDTFRKPDGPVRSVEHVSKLIGEDTSTILVAEGQDRLLGLAVVAAREVAAHPLLVPRQLVEINTVVVRKDARRQGIGRSLIEAALHWARQREVTAVEISVYAFNQEALRAYMAAGFTMSVHRLTLTLPAPQA